MCSQLGFRRCRIYKHFKKYNNCFIYCFQSIFYLVLLTLLAKCFMSIIYINNLKNIAITSCGGDNNQSASCNNWEIDYDWNNIATPTNMYMTDPRLIDLLLRNIITELPHTYNLTHSRIFQHDIVPLILSSVPNITKGFFIEFGAGDGETLSPTLQLEKEYKWTGLLVEADPMVTDQLIMKGRQSYITNTCLGYYNKSYMGLFGIRKNFNSKLVTDKWENYDYIEHTMCYPLYTFLKAINKTKVDLIIIDINGNELETLKTLPFDKVHINVIIVRYRTLKELKNINGYFVQSNYEVFAVKYASRHVVLKLLK